MTTIDELMLRSPRGIGHGLVLRRSSKNDSERLAEFNSRIHGDDETDRIRVGVWTKDMLSGNHPTMHSDDFTIVEEKKTGKIISSLNLIPQTWSYRGIPFAVGRPEAVGTDPEFRNRGLVRLQFECVHEWSKQRGDLLQGITGIPYYYRLFGYEMAVELDASNIGYESQVPKLAEGEEERYFFRLVNEEDIPFLMQLDDKATKPMLLHCSRDVNSWRYEISGRSLDNCSRRQIMVIQDRENQRLGAIMHPFYLDHDYSSLIYYELTNEASFANITPAVIRYIWNTGKKYSAESGKKMLGFNFVLVGEHPAIKVASNYLPKQKRPYAWYIRVPDLLKFLLLVSPALEYNLAHSVCSGYTGSLDICLYSKAIKIEMQDGKISNIAESKYPDEKKMDVSFPGLTFLQILFGWRDIYELRYAFSDCTLKEEKLALVESLFPKIPSRIWPLE
jgi:hypothetical protein